MKCPQTPNPETTAETRWGAYTGQNEAEGQVAQPEPEALLQPVSERVLLPITDAAKPLSAQSIWEASYHQLEFQLDQGSFSAWVRDAALVDFEPETTTFVLVVPSVMAQKMLAGKLDRMIRRVLADVYGAPVQIKYLLKDEWVEQGTVGEQIA